MVLLKNDGILPLKKEEIHTIGIIGPNANSRNSLIGNYHGTSSEYVTVLEGMKQAAGDQIRVLYSEGCHLWKDTIEHLAAPGQPDRLAEAQAVAEYQMWCSWLWDWMKLWKEKKEIPEIQMLPAIKKIWNFLNHRKN